MSGSRWRLCVGIVLLALVVSACAEDTGEGTTTSAVSDTTMTTEGSSEATTTTGEVEEPSAPSVDELGDISIEMWQHTYPPLNTWTEARIAEFTTAHPNVTIEFQAIPFQQYQDQLFTALAAGDAPVFFEVNDWTMTQFVDADVIVPLDLAALGFDSLDGIRSVYEGLALEGAIFENDLYGSPYDWSAPVLGVNNQMLADAGIDKATLSTWETTLESASTMSETNADGNLVTSGLSFVHGIDNYYKHQGNSLFAQAGAKVISDDGTQAAINSPEARQVFQLWSDAIHEYQVTQPGFTSTFYTNEFGEGRVGSGFMLTWANSILAPFGWEFGNQYDILPLPTFEGGNDTLASYAWYWTLSSQATEEEAVVVQALIKHLSENSANMLTEAGLILPRVEWFESQSPEVQASYATIREALLKAEPVPGHPRYNEIWEPVITVFEAVEANPEADIDALLEAAELQINGIINRP